MSQQFPAGTEGAYQSSCLCKPQPFLALQRAHPYCAFKFLMKKRDAHVFLFCQLLYCKGVSEMGACFAENKIRQNRRESVDFVRG